MACFLKVRSTICLKNFNRGIVLLLFCPPAYVGLLTLLLQLVQKSLGVMATIEHPLLPLLTILLLRLCEQVPMPEVRAIDVTGLHNEWAQN
jgi:hypothetical protein